MERIDRGDGIKIAYQMRPGRGPVLVFLPGYNSHMGSGKATALDRYCEEQGRAMLRLDYSGNGESEGRFEDGTIGQWTADAACVIDHAIQDRRLVLIGSSMGGWVALLLALRYGARVAGIVLIAPAVDYTEELLWPRLKPAQQRKLMEQGSILLPRDEGDPYLITRAFIEDGRKNSLKSDTPVAIDAPIRILHGQQDKVVPWRMSLHIAKAVRSEDVRMVFVKDGAHRMSRPKDLALLMGFFGENGL